MRRRRNRIQRTAPLAILALTVAALLWMIPFAWMAVASFRPQSAATGAMASLVPTWPPTGSNFAEAWGQGQFPLWYLNTLIMCGGILAVQAITITAAGYVFARLSFPGRTSLFYLFLVQLMLTPAILIVPNLTTIVHLGLYDRLPGVMAPYLASAFGTFLMRQTFRAIPRDYEDAAMIDGASVLQLIWYVLLPLARPGLAAFAIVSVSYHWNDFLWPLVALSSPAHQVLTVGLASFTTGAESGTEWGVVAAGTLLVAAPLIAVFIVFQRRIVSSFVFSGVK